MSDSACAQEVNRDLAPTSLFLFGTENVVRKPLIRLVRWPMFEWFMLTVILANCVTLAMYSNKPGFPESAVGIATQQANVCFIAIFLAEAACKILALGFVLEKHMYLRDGARAAFMPSLSCLHA